MIRIATVKTAMGTFVYAAPTGIKSDGDFLIIEYMGMARRGIHMFPLQLSVENWDGGEPESSHNLVSDAKATNEPLIGCEKPVNTPPLLAGYPMEWDDSYRGYGHGV